MSRYLIALITLLTQLPASAHSEEFTPQRVWTIDNLVGKAPSYPGPSCYTAALLAKGYETTVTYVGVKEMRFFIDNFCNPKNGPMQPGDVLTLSMRDSKEKPPFLDHVAVYLGDGKIFEKELGAGTYEPANPKEDPHFHIKDLRESIWFKNYEGDGRVLNTYLCQEASVVHSRLATCEKRAQDVGVDTVRRALEKTMFMTPPAFSLDPQALNAIKRLTQALREIAKSDPCFDYIVAMGDSVDFGLKSIRVKLLAALPNAAEWNKAKDELADVMFHRFTL